MATGNARRLVGGSALRSITLVTGILVAFYIRPFLVHTLGDRWFGFWAVAGSIVGYYSILDLGLTVAAHRFLALAYAREDRHETSRVFTTALALFTAGGGVALLLTGVMWAGVPLFVKVAADIPTVRMLVLLLGINFAVGFPVAIYHGVLAANLRYDLSSYLQLGRLVFRTILVVIGLGHTPSVVLLAAITLGTDLLCNFATAVAAMRLWPWLEVSPRLFDRSRVREFFNFGFFAFVIRVGDLVRFSLDNVVVAVFLGVATVSHYTIATQLMEYFQNVVMQAIGVLTPVFSRFHGLDDREGLVFRVRQASRLAVAMSAPMAGGAVIFGAPFIRRWMGPAYLDAYWPLVILMGSALIAVMQTPSTAYLVAIGRHKYYAWLNGGDAIANLVLSLLLASRFGMLGVAVGTAIPTLVVKLVLQPRYVCQQMGISMRSYWAELGAVFVRTIGLQIPIAVIVWFVAPTTYPSIIALSAVLYGIFALALFVFVLEADDQRVLSAAFPALDRLIVLRKRVTLVFRGSA